MNLYSQTSINKSLFPKVLLGLFLVLALLIGAFIFQPSLANATGNHHHNPAPEPDVSQCMFYGVQDFNIGNSQFFNIDTSVNVAASLGPVLSGYNIEGLDIHPTSGVIYAGASDGSFSGTLFTVAGDGSSVTEVGNSGYDIEALSFRDTDGTLWGWAEDNGLIKIDISDGSATLELVSAKNFEGIAWNNEGTLLYGVVNSKLYVYNPADDSMTKLTRSIPGEAESLEILPDGNLIGGYHDGGNNSLFFYDIDANEIILSSIVTGAFDDIEGLSCAYVPPPTTQCSDGIDNDGDSLIDYPDDLGCDSSDDDDENSKPVITLLGNNPLTHIVGNVFTDPNATADDEEDGDITANIVVGGDSVSSTTPTGTYTITYNVVDSEGLAADEVTRVVEVVLPDPSNPPVCIFDPQDDRTIVNFDTSKKLWSSDVSKSETAPVSVSLGAGNYKISLFSFDGYTNRVNVSQPNESWFVKLLNGTDLVAESNAIGDLEDNVAIATLSEVVNESLNASSSVDSVIGFHAFYPDTSNANSVSPICAAFDLLPPVPQCSDGIDNDGDGNIDHPDDLGCDNPEDDDENEAPVITVLGDNPLTVVQNSTSTDPGAEASDPEDGDLTLSIVTVGGNFNTSILGTTTITYNVVDSKGVPAPEQTREVLVIPEGYKPQCSDGVDNGDGDGLADILDPTCHTDGDPENPDSYNPNIDDENSVPEITVLGDNPLTVFQNSTTTDPGATASDSEDGDLTLSIVAVGNNFDTSILGTTTVSYNVSDSKGASAPEQTRLVDVIETTQCSDGIDNDGDSLIDYPDDLGCDSSDDDDENSKPIITLLGNNPLTHIVGNVFTDPSAEATDEEDDDVVLTAAIVVAGNSISSTTPTGTYTITYNVTDSGGLAADEVTRVVEVVVVPQCSDNLDNDEDQKIDIDDPACHTDGDPENPDSYDPDINNENSKPVITLIGANPFEITKGDSFTDPSATASDDEDGDITVDIVVAGSTVDPNVVGTYTITYNVEDSEGLNADEVTRTVNVVVVPPPPPPPPPPPTCTSNCGGGGGGNPIDFEITNEKVEQIGSGTVLVTWDSNLQGTSQVHYDLASYPTSAIPFNEYNNEVPETNVYTFEHGLVVSGLKDNVLYYFRPQSNRTDDQAGGIELNIVLGATTTPPITPPSGPTCEEYLLDYIKIGENNNPTEVFKLQTFLRDFEGFENIPVNGVYDQVTFDAVTEFQERYGQDILDPWGLPENTGYVYYTTKKKVNEIYCQREFPLASFQLAEIEDFKNLIQSAPAGTIDTSTVGFDGVGGGSLAELDDITDAPTSLGLEDSLIGEGSDIAGIGAVSDDDNATSTSSFAGNFAGVIGGLGDPTILLPIVLLVIAGIIIYLMTKKDKPLSNDSDKDKKNPKDDGKNNGGDKGGNKGGGATPNKPIILLPSKGQDNQKKPERKDTKKTPSNISSFYNPMNPANTENQTNNSQRQDAPNIRNY